MMERMKRLIREKGKKGMMLLLGYVILKWTVLLTFGRWLMAQDEFRWYYLLILPVTALTWLGIRGKLSAKKNGGLQ